MLEATAPPVTRRAGFESAMGWSLVCPAVVILLLMTISPTIYPASIQLLQLHTPQS